MAVEQGDVLEATVIHDNAETGEQINRYQFQLGNATSPSDADVVDDVLDMLEALYLIIRAVINVRNALREVKVFDVTQDRLLGSGLLGTYTGGTGGNPAAPQGVAILTYFPTDVPRVILSKYWPSPPIGAVESNGSLTGSTKVLGLAYIAELLTEYVGVVGLYRYGYLSPKTLGFEVPTVGIIPDVFAYQRRRKKGRGS